MEDLVPLSDDFDPVRYARLPRFDVVTGIALAQQLLAVLQGLPASDAVRRGADKLQCEAQALQRVWLEQESAHVAAEPAPVDQIADHAWRLLHDRLAAYAALPADLHPEAARAAEILTSLFPDGLSFLALDYAAQFRESQARLQRLEDRGYMGDLHQLVGTAFVVEVQRCQRLYGMAIGATPTPQTPPTPLSEPLRAMTQALLSLCAQLVALYFEGDSPQRTMVRSALRPIDDFRVAVLDRARAFRRDGTHDTGSGPAPAPSTPSPAAPGKK